MRVIMCALTLLVAGQLSAHAQEAGLIEPQAGTWKTWVITSGSQFRAPPPPDRIATEKELGELAQIAATRDAAALDRVAYWNTGSPSYRWSEIAVAEHLRIGTPWQIATRDLALMHIAIYDAMVAAWDSKYAYKRPRPSAVNADLALLLPNPPSPSYPAEHAVAAGAASEVLAYIFPERAEYFRKLAEEAAHSRLIAGVNYPSDVAAGTALGRQVAALVIARGKSDGTDAKWSGSVPTGPGKWTGVNPILPMAGTWKPRVLSAPGEFRPGPPVAYDSLEKAAELAEIKGFPRNAANKQRGAGLGGRGGRIARLPILERSAQPQNAGIPARRQSAARRACCHSSPSMISASPAGKPNTPTGRFARSSSTRTSNRYSPRPTIQATRRRTLVPRSPSPGRSAICSRAIRRHWQRSARAPRSRASGPASTIAATSSPAANSPLRLLTR